jgi:hypothetical protein
MATDIAAELSALPPLDSIPATVDQVAPIRIRYLNQARANAQREQWGDPLVIARLQAINDACDRFIQLAVVRLWPRWTLCTHSLALLNPEERAGL